MARDRINQWAKCDFFNPTEVLQGAFQQGVQHRLGGRTNIPNVPHQVKRNLVEDLDAAIFTHGLRQMLPDKDVCIAEFEAQDHDFVLRFNLSGKPGYCPLQLKVLVSTDVNPNLTPDGLISALSKYADASDLTVAINIDRLNVDPRSLSIPPLGIAELWFFGPRPETETGWYLYGDAMQIPTWFEFHIPASATL